MNKRDLLFFCSSCKHTTDDELANLECTIPHITKRYKKGEYIGYHGDRVKSLMILISGKVKTEIVSSTGLALPMEEIKAPYPLAAAFLFGEHNHLPVDIIALDNCEVVFITKENVEKQIAACPGFLQGFMSFTANRMYYMSERLKIFAQKGIKAKIAYYILSKEKNGEFDLERSIASLAEFFAVERPSLSRALSEMVHDGIITLNGRKGHIQNNKKMEEILIK